MNKAVMYTKTRPLIVFTSFLIVTSVALLSRGTIFQVNGLPLKIKDSFKKTISLNGLRINVLVIHSNGRPATVLHYAMPPGSTINGNKNIAIGSIVNAGDFAGNGFFNMLVGLSLSYGFESTWSILVETQNMNSARLVSFLQSMEKQRSSPCGTSNELDVEMESPFRMKIYLIKRSSINGVANRLRASGYRNLGGSFFTNPERNCFVTLTGEEDGADACIEICRTSR